jgi:hypothetical protein
VVRNCTSVIGFHVSLRFSSITLITESTTFCSISVSARFGAAVWPVPPSRRSTIAKATAGLSSSAPTPSSGCMPMA